MKVTTFAKTIIFLLIITSAVSCNSADKKMAAPAPAPKTDTPVTAKVPSGPTEASLLGKWKFSEYYDEAATTKLLKLETDKGTITYAGESTYYEGGTGKSEGQITFTYIETESGTKLNMKFDFSNTFTWKISGNDLLETTVDGKLDPANDETAELVKLSPSLSESFRPLKGETEKSRILNYTPTLIELEGEDKARLTMHKEQ